MVGFGQVLNFLQNLANRGFLALFVYKLHAQEDTNAVCRVGQFFSKDSMNACINLNELTDEHIDK